MPKLHFLNVGHGDSTIIEHGDGKITMIDINNGDDLDTASAIDSLLGGYSVSLTNPVEYYWQNFGGRPIFRYIQTHPDFDHMRGLSALVDSGVEILNFWDTEHTRRWDPERDRERDLDDWEAYEKLRSGKGGAKVLRLFRGSAGKYWNQTEDGQAGGNGLQILSPTPELVAEFDQDGERNELSYVISYRCSNRRIIFGGDAGENAWEAMFRRYGIGLKCDVLKASHHGRDSGFHLEAVKAMAPGVTVVSVGRKPETDASNKYRAHSRNVWSTRWYGDLTLEIDGNGAMKWMCSEERRAA